MEGGPGLGRRGLREKEGSGQEEEEEAAWLWPPKRDQANLGLPGTWEGLSEGRRNLPTLASRAVPWVGEGLGRRLCVI